MSEPIFLFIFEGKRDESKYLDEFLKCLDVEINRIEIAYCTNIYALCNKIKQDSTLDTFELLKELHSLKGDLKNCQRNQITSIYFFFDYDGHHPRESNNENIELMLNQFDDETMQGKLYISYPMLESLRHKTDDNFPNAISKIALGKEYKNSQDIEHISCIKNNCKQLTSSHIKKANDLVNNKFELPNTIIDSADIFAAQLKKHINPNIEVAILSALPLFVLDYKGVSYIKTL